MAQKNPEVQFKPKMRAKELKVDGVLAFSTYEDLEAWIREVGAKPLCSEEPLILTAYWWPKRFYYVVDGAVFEAVYEPIPPEQPRQSYMIAGELSPEARKYMKAALELDKK